MLAQRQLSTNDRRPLPLETYHHHPSSQTGALTRTGFGVSSACAGACAMRPTARTLTSKTHPHTQAPAQVSELGTRGGPLKTGVVTHGAKEGLGVRDSGCVHGFEGIAGNSATQTPLGLGMVQGKSQPPHRAVGLQAPMSWAQRSLECYGTPVGMQPNLQNQSAALTNPKQQGWGGRPTEGGLLTLFGVCNVCHSGGSQCQRKQRRWPQWHRCKPPPGRQPRGAACATTSLTPKPQLC